LDIEGRKLDGENTFNPINKSLQIHKAHSKDPIPKLIQGGKY